MGYMKIQASKVFAKYMNKVASEHNVRFNASVVDYMGERVIRVAYPYEYYAVPKYMSTEYLNKEFRVRGVKDVAGLERMILDICEI